MDTTTLDWPRALLRLSTIVCAAVLTGCVVPATSVHYGQVASDPGVYYDPAPVYSPGTYYGPGPYYVPPAVIVDRPVIYPWYPVAPGFGAHFHGHRGDSHRHHPDARGPGFRPDQDRRPDHGAARPPPPSVNPNRGMRPNQGGARSGAGGPGVRLDSGENSGP